MTRSTITAAIITLNEERNLPRLLSRLDWADEIVVVDGGSRDATVEIARDKACAVVVRRFDSFAEQRNQALRMANCDWVLSVDADERPTPALAAEVRERIAKARVSAFRVPIRSSIFGRQVRFCGTQGDRPIRLFRRSAGYWSGDVHEKLAVDGRVGVLRHWLEHETLPDLSNFLAKMNRYTSLAARERLAAGRPPRTRDAWLAPAREVFRRLIWKHGLLDGPEGWAFCLLSGLSEWVLWHKHRELWREKSGECRVASDEWQAGGVNPLIPSRRADDLHEDIACTAHVVDSNGSGCTPSPGTPGEGWGEGAATKSSPHSTPSPRPSPRGRGRIPSPGTSGESLPSRHFSCDREAS